jgi:SAM-dependent methyltransferase
MDEQFELLSVSLLDSERKRITELKNLAHRLKLEFGWHYLLDISWVLRQIDTIASKKIIDAGAGTGVIQWYLAENGATVISVDRESRKNLPSRFRRRFTVEGLRPRDLSSEKGSAGMSTKSLKTMAVDWIDQIRYSVGQYSSNPKPIEPGKVIIYNQDLTDLADIGEDSVDTIVAVSSLEHNSPEGLEAVVAELMRVLRPGGALVATLGASRDDDWFHEPSQGWCYSEQTLRRIFQISSETPSNYSQYDLLFENLIKNQELHDNLASFYFQSGDNGMPWGEWNPEYQPVGVCKRKDES